MQVFNVQGMTCAHCVRAVTNAIQEQDPTAQVQVDLAKGEVKVQSQLEAEQVMGLIQEEGYTATRAQ
ncbi:heavy-metal-associated domain-containing protein [Pseudomonas petrae]|uniref:Cation transporter n=1 Tax=Pseudomonas petrae TaxID=2912190 RepID=A0ABS9I6K9_9PSED|nr:cation transporter [Pseudomonas petrae]MCF7531926.1 cation transporter [Pseudomonas petrae]MCF7537489.1 cation transporter [Pseudomonas petrae]MCF7542646.1 cation transporter [Pseudomonas petrae]MCF7556754.1 cation transporter [Pseudomonas petrae]